MSKSACGKLLSKQMYSLKFVQETVHHYFQTLYRMFCCFVTLFLTLQGYTSEPSAIHTGGSVPGKSGVLLSAAAEGSAADVVPQLLYEFRVLLLYLLSKLLPRLDKARQVC